MSTTIRAISYQNNYTIDHIIFPNHATLSVFSSCHPYSSAAYIDSIIVFFTLQHAIVLNRDNNKKST